MAGTLERQPQTEQQQPLPPEAAAAVAQPAPAEPVPADAAAVGVPLAAKVCKTCGSGLTEDQDWCLECGSAQPGRLGGRPGWRAALTVLAITGLLTGGAAAAGYAALSSESERVASAPPPPAATPQVTPPPEQTAPPAETTAPEEDPVVEAPPSEPADVPEATAPADDGLDDGFDDPIDVPSGSSDIDSGTSSSGSTGSTGTSGSTGSDDSTSGSTGSGDSSSGEDDATDDEPDGPAPIDLSADAASTYDPENRGGGQVGDPADAVDGKASTAWEAPVNPADGQVRVGLVLSLEEVTALKALQVKADTPGFTFEVYGTRATEIPADPLDSRWESLGSKKDAGVTSDVELDGRYRHVLVWITDQPADTKVAIPEIALSK